MDRLEEIFAMQSALNGEIIALRHLEGVSREEWLQKQSLALLVEMGEVLEEAGYKWWKDKKPVDSDALKGELVDVLHFFVSLCLSAGLDAEELHRRYLEKNQVNFDRQHGLTDRAGYAAIGKERTEMP